jgi:hypothetical protein
MTSGVGVHAMGWFSSRLLSVMAEIQISTCDIAMDHHHELDLDFAG